MSIKTFSKFQSLCRSLDDDGKVAVSAARSIVLYKSAGLCPANWFVDAQSGALLPLHELCSSQTFDLVNKSDSNLLDKNLEKFIDVAVEKETKARLYKSMKCVVTVFLKAKILQLMKKSDANCKEFRATLFHMKNVKLCGIHFFRWDGTPRQSVSEINWAICHYPSSSMDMSKVLSVIFGAAVVAAFKLGQRLKNRKRVPIYSHHTVTYVKACDIEPRALQFFERILNDRLSVSVDPCQDIGRALLKKCVTPDEIKYYTFEKVLGIGYNGFVFQCLYKNTERRAVKLVLITNSSSQKKITSENEIIRPVTKTQVNREFNTHYDLLQLQRMTPSLGFKVLNIFGKLAIFKPPSSKYEIGVYIMQSLPAPTLHHEVEQNGGGRMPRSILQKIGTIPRVIANLQEYGYAHSDLHIGNICFDPSDPDRPIVLDFGRTVHLSSTFTDLGERSTFRLFDYVQTLWRLLWDHTAYNVFVDTMDTDLTNTVRGIWTNVASLKERNSMDSSKAVIFDMLREIFTPIEDDIEKIRQRDSLIYLVTKSWLFKNGTANFYKIVEPS
jgi:hypothetical protein